MLKPGDAIEHYRIVERIGQGGMAIVYLVIDENLDAKRALKELSHIHANDPGWRARFHAEAKLAASLDHPSIVTIHDHFVNDDIPYIVMQYHSLGSARPIVGTSLTRAQVIGLLVSVLDGLEAAEAAGIVHRDLKPDNLLRTKQGTVQISDFGIARVLADPRETPADQLHGSHFYVAPELVRGSEASALSDLYSVGVIAYELFRGWPPFHRSVSEEEVLVRKTRENALPMRVVVPDLHIGVADWVDRLLSRQPLKRYPSAATARRELEEAAEVALGSDWRQRSALPTIDEPLPPMERPPEAIESRFVPIVQLKKIVSLPRHIASSIASPLPVIVAGTLVLVGILRQERWMFVIAGLSFGMLATLRFFDQQAAYDSRGLRFERIKTVLRHWLEPAEG